MNIIPDWIIQPFLCYAKTMAKTKTNPTPIKYAVKKESLTTLATRLAKSTVVDAKQKTTIIKKAIAKKVPKIEISPCVVLTYGMKHDEKAASCMNNDPTLTFYERIGVRIIRAVKDDTVLGRTLLWSTMCDTRHMFVMDRIFGNEEIREYIKEFGFNRNFYYRRKQGNGVYMTNSMETWFPRVQFDRRSFESMIDLPYLDTFSRIQMIEDKVNLYTRGDKRGTDSCFSTLKGRVVLDTHRECIIFRLHDVINQQSVISND